MKGKKQSNTTSSTEQKRKRARRSLGSEQSKDAESTIPSAASEPVSTTSAHQEKITKSTSKSSASRRSGRQTGKAGSAAAAAKDEDKSLPAMTTAGAVSAPDVPRSRRTTRKRLSKAQASHQKEEEEEEKEEDDMDEEVDETCPSDDDCNGSEDEDFQIDESAPEEDEEYNPLISSRSHSHHHKRPRSSHTHGSGSGKAAPASSIPASTAAVPSDWVRPTITKREIDDQYLRKDSNGNTYYFCDSCNSRYKDSKGMETHILYSLTHDANNVRNWKQCPMSGCGTMCHPTSLNKHMVQVHGIGQRIPRKKRSRSAAALDTGDEEEDEPEEVTIKPKKRVTSKKAKAQSQAVIEVPSAPTKPSKKKSSSSGSSAKKRKLNKDAEPDNTTASAASAQPTLSSTPVRESSHELPTQQIVQQSPGEGLRALLGAISQKHGGEQCPASPPAVTKITTEHNSATMDSSLPVSVVKERNGDDIIISDASKAIVTPDSLGLSGKLGFQMPYPPRTPPNIMSMRIDPEIKKESSHHPRAKAIMEPQLLNTGMLSPICAPVTANQSFVSDVDFDETMYDIEAGDSQLNRSRSELMDSLFQSPGERGFMSPTPDRDLSSISARQQLFRSPGFSPIHRTNGSEQRLSFPPRSFSLRDDCFSSSQNSRLSTPRRLFSPRFSTPTSSSGTGSQSQLSSEDIISLQIQLEQFEDQKPF